MYEDRGDQQKYLFTNIRVTYNTDIVEYDSEECQCVRGNCESVDSDVQFETLSVD